MTSRPAGLGTFVVRPRHRPEPVFLMWYTLKFPKVPVVPAGSKHHPRGEPWLSYPWQRKSWIFWRIARDPLGSSTHNVLFWACRYGLKISDHPAGGMTAARAVPGPAMARPAASPIAASAPASFLVRPMSRPPDAVSDTRTLAC